MIRLAVVGLALLISLASNLVQRAENRRLRQQTDALLAGLNSPAAVVSADGTRPRASVSPAEPLQQTVGGVTGAASAEPATPTDHGPMALRVCKELTCADLLALTNSLALFPNGIRVVPGENPGGVIEVDPLAVHLIHGYNLLASGQCAEAGEVFAGVLKACPQWPYGFYYLALATGRRDHMEQAEKRLCVLESLGRAKPESQLYHALADLYLGDHESIKVWLATHEARANPPVKMMLGPLYIPETIPAAIRRRLEKIKGLPLLQTSGAVR